MSQIPKEQRETFKDKDIDVLEFMVGNMPTKSNPEPSARGVIKSNKNLTNWLDLNPKEQKGNWNDILNSYKNKK